MRLIKMTTLIVFMVFAQNILAQKGRPMHKNHQDLTDLIDISEEQSAELVKINDDFRSEIRSIAENEAEKEEKLKSIENALEKKRSETEKILTAEQLKEIELKRKSRRAEQLYNSIEKRKSTKALRNEIRAHYESQIHPVVVKWRAEFDKNITEEDKETIEKTKLIREERKAEREKLRKEIEDGKKSRGEIRQRRTQDMRRGSDKEKSMEGLVEPYMDEINEIKNENQDQLDKWELEIKEIIRKHRNEQVELDRSMSKKGIRKRRQGRKEKDILNPHKFLLMDF